LAVINDQRIRLRASELAPLFLGDDEGSLDGLVGGGRETHGFADAVSLAHGSRFQSKASDCQL
jgi:hypothetical protein